MPWKDEKAPNWIRELEPAIPYFYQKDTSKAKAVFIGRNVLTKLNTLILKVGGVSSLLQNIFSNIRISCKMDGKRIVALHRWGSTNLKKEEFQHYDKIVSKYTEHFLVKKEPEQLELPIKSSIKKTDWEWLLSDWTLASVS